MNYTPATDLLKDRVILVTGAGQGIGRCAALTYAQHGATVLLLGRNQKRFIDVMQKRWETIEFHPMREHAGLLLANH